MEDGREICAVDGCGRRVCRRRGKFCRSHERKAQQGRLDEDIRPRGQTRGEVLREAARAFADSDGSVPLERNLAWHRLKTAAMRYRRSERMVNKP